MRGEKALFLFFIGQQEGSPPHARGKATGCSSAAQSKRITPACAGKSFRWRLVIPSSVDHPRMRGEKKHTELHFERDLGSPPHARGKVEKSQTAQNAFRITPACAGKRLKKIPNYKHFQNRTHQISFSFKNTLYSVSQSGNALCNSQEMPKYSAKDPNL